MQNRPGFLAHLHPPTIPQASARLTYTWGLGGISILLILILLITGTLELFLYQPTEGDAYFSVAEIAFRAPFGWFFRNLHYWAGQWLIITAMLHMARIVFTGAYKNRRTNWLIGIALLLLTLALNFTGLVLRWDANIAWALLVGTNLIREIPLIGDSFYRLLVGGDAINSSTVTHFYGWHIVGLMLPLFFMLIWHGWRLRRDGGIGYAVDQHRPRIDRRELMQLEGITILIVLLVLGTTCLIWNAPLAAPADFNNPPEVNHAPWFFLGIQELLRLADPLIAGILIPAGVVILIAALPYLLDRRSEGIGQWLNREGRVLQILFALIVIMILALTVQGAMR